ncbi:DUF4365 domain-containing protein [Streptomyces sp. NBC_01214]|uniref:DUF4365 domain-containing protein n=1 Tax=Streptomyces sp. NBC_01214 TaxID=2903777 RepID=UPI002256BE49|nr:DUF4365 domain-containing protein [Streptomyces sp. NBC_01214]MCX4806286.1 DUF4365 domain-containing protein [Streptomyces sp. NBC_01214]
MEHNNHQGWYGETFVAAIAAAAGFQVAVPYPDIGKDLILGRDHEEPELDVQIALQVKTHRVESIPDAVTGFKITLSVSQFKRLRGKRQVPVYLVVVLVPKDPADYIRTDEDALVLRRCAYWVSLEHHVPAQAGRESVTVTVPRDNLLTVDALHEFFARACEEVPAP